MIRLICIVVFLILYLILSIPVFLVEWLIGKFNPQARDKTCFKKCNWVMCWLLSILGHYLLKYSNDWNITAITSFIAL